MHLYLNQKTTKSLIMPTPKRALIIPTAPRPSKTTRHAQAINQEGEPIQLRKRAQGSTRQSKKITQDSSSIQLSNNSQRFAWISLLTSAPREHRPQILWLLIKRYFLICNLMVTILLVRLTFWISTKMVTLAATTGRLVSERLTTQRSILR